MKPIAIEIRTGGRRLLKTPGSLPWIVGRSDSGLGLTVAVDDAGVSRRHFEVHARDGHTFVRSLSAEAPTFILRGDRPDTPLPTAPSAGALARAVDFAGRKLYLAAPELTSWPDVRMQRLTAPAEAPVDDDDVLVASRTLFRLRGSVATPATAPPEAPSQRVAPAVREQEILTLAQALWRRTQNAPSVAVFEDEVRWGVTQLRGDCVAFARTPAGLVVRSPDVVARDDRQLRFVTAEGRQTCAARAEVAAAMASSALAGRGHPDAEPAGFAVRSDDTPVVACVVVLGAGRALWIEVPLVIGDDPALMMGVWFALPTPPGPRRVRPAGAGARAGVEQTSASASAVGPADALAALVGESVQTRELRAEIGRLADSRLPVLIRGETGTGKELVARALHDGNPETRTGPWIAVNCGALDERQLATELFGTKGGAWTDVVHDVRGRIEAAHGGTLFLDEVGAMGPALQAALLRVLDAGEYNRQGDVDTRRSTFRVVAATSEAIEARLGTGFRPDLFQRLTALRIEISPLRERRDDIEAIVRAVESAWRDDGSRTGTFGEAAVRALCDSGYAFPGNVRELRFLALKLLELHARRHGTVTADAVRAEFRDRAGEGAGGGAVRDATAEALIDEFRTHPGGRTGQLAARALLDAMLPPPGAPPAPPETGVEPLLKRVYGSRAHNKKAVYELRAAVVVLLLLEVDALARSEGRSPRLPDDLEAIASIRDRAGAGDFARLLHRGYVMKLVKARRFVTRSERGVLASLCAIVRASESLASAAPVDGDDAEVWLHALLGRFGPA